MPSNSKIKNISRIIDANINRAKEGLRVSEEITRFILNSRPLTEALKKIRHKIDGIFKKNAFGITVLQQRQSSTDIGKSIYINELKRKDWQDIFFANMQRVKESIRVLEEFTKLINQNIAVEFKDIRYVIYEIEKKAAKKISSLCYRR